MDDCILIRNNQGGCATGEAVITTAGNLLAQFVIHTVGPVWNGGNKDEEKLLQDCYTNSLKLAIENDVRTIAFPNISTGIYHFPKEMAAQIALKAITEFEYFYRFEEIVIVCFDDENFKIYNKIYYHE